jgi:hypothetical protein
MNYRNATLMERKRKNVKFEQERADSLDHDAQRAGGVHPKDVDKKPKPSPKGSKSSPKED